MRKKGIILAFTSSLIYGFIPILSIYAYAEGSDPFSLVFLNTLIVMPLIVVIAYLKKASLKTSWEELSKIALVSVVNLLTNILLSISYVYIGAGTATSLHFFYPVLVVLIIRIIYGTKISNKQRIALFIGVVGVLLFMDVYDVNRIIGVTTALASGLTYALYIVWIEKMQLTKINSARLIFYLSLTSIVYMLLFNLLSIDMFTINLDTSIVGYFYILIIGILIYVFAMAFVVTGTKLLGSVTISMISLFEPVSSVVFGFVLLNEHVSMMNIIGCTLIIISIIKLMKNK
ncbi:MAG: DMT family transporter [Erysipelotrichaceae bacterium]|nr:DMT family transporter [Erysipelotrichaceae bacterium]